MINICLLRNKKRSNFKKNHKKWLGQIACSILSDQDYVVSSGNHQSPIETKTGPWSLNWASDLTMVQFRVLFFFRFRAATHKVISTRALKTYCGDEVIFFSCEQKKGM